MAKQTWKEYIFADGHHVVVRNLSKQELAVEERKYGKVVQIIKC